MISLRIIWTINLKTTNLGTTKPRSINPETFNLWTIFHGTLLGGMTWGVTMSLGRTNKEGMTGDGKETGVSDAENLGIRRL
jgi:hypothetical protein